MNKIISILTFLCLGAAAHAAEPSINNRLEMGKQIKLSPSCNKTFSKENTDESGMYLRETEPGAKLLFAICSYGAYQGTQQVFLLPNVDALMFEKLSDEEKVSSKLMRVNTISTNIRWEKSSATLSVTDKFSGAGNCGLRYDYKLDGAAFNLIAIYGNTDCDAESKETDWLLLKNMKKN